MRLSANNPNHVCNDDFSKLGLRMAPSCGCSN